MKKTFKFLPIALMGILLFVGCKKDDSVTFFATTQPYTYGGNEKMYIEQTTNGSGNPIGYACWANGDMVKINGTIVTASVINTTGYSTVRFTGVPKDDSETPAYYAIYPASIVADGDDDGDPDDVSSQTPVSIPQLINYSISQGNQVLNAPMAAKADVNNEMNFVNLCTLIKVHFDAVNSIIDQIQIEASTGFLSGSGTVDFDGSGNPSLNITHGNSDVILNLGTGVNLSSGADFYIPIVPISAGCTLTFNVREKIGAVIRQISYCCRVDTPNNSVITMNGPTINSVEDYTFYDYIWSRESGYINLNLKPKDYSKFEVIFVPGNVTASQYICGSRGPQTSGSSYIQWFTMTGSQNTTWFRATLCNNGVNNETPNGWIRERNKKYRQSLYIMKDGTERYGRAVFENLTDSVNGQPKTNTLYTARYNGEIPTGVNNVLLFGITEDDLHKDLKVYRFQYSENGVLRKDFIPCIYHDRTDPEHPVERIGVYDLVSARFIAPTPKAGARYGFQVGND